MEYPRTQYGNELLLYQFLDVTSENKESFCICHLKIMKLKTLLSLKKILYGETFRTGFEIRETDRRGIREETYAN